MKVGIIVAMEEEISILRESLEGFQVEEKHPFTFYTGSIAGHEVVLLECGIGKVNSSIGATILLRDFTPDVVINTGVAGGLGDGMKIGDIAVSTGFYQHDVDVTILDYERGQVPGMPTFFDADKDLCSLLSTAVKDLGVSIFRGYIASGDIFVHNREHMESIKDIWADTVAVEMEAAALAQVCFRFGVPFCAIRAISDLPLSDSSKVDYRTFMPKAAALSASVVVKSLRLLS